MNPKDIMTDAIHNFHPQYQQYTQYSAGMYQFCTTIPYFLTHCCIIIYYVYIRLFICFDNYLYFN